MQNRHLYSLLDTSYVTIKVAFGSAARLTPTEVEDDMTPLARSGTSVKRPHVRTAGEEQRLYVYKAPKEAGLKVDDAVVVDSPSNGLQVVRVVEVHETTEIDLDAPFEYKWIVQKVDRKSYDEQLERERKFAGMMLEVERTNQREKLMNDMRANLPEGSSARQLFDSATSLIGHQQ